VFQIVRRVTPPTATEQATNLVRNVSARENFLSKALIAILSVNIFMLSSVLSFCMFVFLYSR
jgi:hypothetical protein